MSQYQQPYKRPQPEINIKKYRPIIFTVVILIILIVVVSKSFVILDPTERGVIFYKYGSGLDTENVYGEGLTMVAPWNEMYRTEVSEQSVTEEMHVLSQDGLEIDLEVTVRFKPLEDKVGDLYKQFRESYIERLIVPELRSAVRGVIGKYKPEELYSTRRGEIEAEVEAIMEEKLSDNNIQLKALLFRSVKLPPTIIKAIETKLAEKQNAERYEFVLLSEQKEAERKIIASKGEATANAILDSSLTTNLLQMRGIEATLELAKAPGSKTVIIGGGEEGLPLILGGGN